MFYSFHRITLASKTDNYSIHKIRLSFCTCEYSQVALIQKFFTIFHSTVVLRNQGETGRIRDEWLVSLKYLNISSYQILVCQSLKKLYKIVFIIHFSALSHLQNEYADVIINVHRFIFKLTLINKNEIKTPLKEILKSITNIYFISLCHFKDQSKDLSKIWIKVET